MNPPEHTRHRHTAFILICPDDSTSPHFAHTSVQSHLPALYETFRFFTPISFVRLAVMYRQPPPKNANAVTGKTVTGLVSAFAGHFSQSEGEEKIEREREHCFQDLEHRECRPCFGSEATFLKDSCLKQKKKSSPCPDIRTPRPQPRPPLNHLERTSSKFKCNQQMLPALSCIYTLSASCRWIFLRRTAISQVIRAGGEIWEVCVSTCMCVCLAAVTSCQPQVNSRLCNPVH